MSQTYYQIELSARMLTALLAALALLLVLAFAFGYGAATSVLKRQGVAVAGATSPTPTPLTSRSRPPATPRPTATHTPRVPATAIPQPTATPRPRPTATVARPRPQPTPAPGLRTDSREFWVQVLAVRHLNALQQAQEKVEQAGFPQSHQQVIPVLVPDGGTLYKLRIGPLPDRPSADRVTLRMREAGFPDCFVLQSER